MALEFNRIITLLRKEKGITQKKASEDLGVSQALLSHYEKGIRECGLEFVVRLAEYYDVSCDYLLGRSADRTGLTLRAEMAEDGTNGAMEEERAALDKKMLTSALHILYDKLAATGDRGLLEAVSRYLLTGVYRMFRTLWSGNPKNAEDLFRVPRHSYGGYSLASMVLSDTEAKAHLGAEEKEKTEAALAMTTENLSKQYPLYTPGLLTLIRQVEEGLKTETDKTL